MVIENYYDLTDLCEEVAEELELKAGDVRDIIEAASAIIAKRVGSSMEDPNDPHPVVLRGIGSFSLSPVQDRAYHIRGEIVEKEDRLKVVFNPAEAFSKIVAKHLPEPIAHLEVL
jgi:nucleoid DNA-binding protein